MDYKPLYYKNSVPQKSPLPFNTQRAEKDKKKIASPYTNSPVSTATNKLGEEEFTAANKAPETYSQPQQPQKRNVPNNSISNPIYGNSQINPYYDFSKQNNNNNSSFSQPQKQINYSDVGTPDNTNYNAAKGIYNLKNKYEQGSANDPNFSQTNEAKYLRGIANHIREDNNLTDDVYGSGVSSKGLNAKYNFDGSVKYLDTTPNMLNDESYSGDSYIDNELAGARKLYNDKVAFEKNAEADPNFIYSPYADYLRKDAESIRNKNNLPTELYGSGVTAEQLLARINSVLDSPEFKAGKAHTNYKDVLKRYDAERSALLTNEVKTRAVLDRLDAMEQAKKQLQPQSEEAIKSAANNVNNNAVRRGMYGQVPTSALSSKAIASTQNQIQSNINNYAQQLIDADRQSAIDEYNVARQNKADKVSALEEAILEWDKQYQAEMAYQNQRKSEQAAREQAAREEARYQDETNWNRYAQQFGLDTDRYVAEDNASYHSGQLANEYTKIANDDFNTKTANEINNKKVEYDNTNKQVENANTAQKNAWDYELGTIKNQNDATKIANDYELGKESNSIKDKDVEYSHSDRQASTAVDWYAATHKSSGGGGSKSKSMTSNQALKQWEIGDTSPEVRSALANFSSNYDFENKTNHIYNNKYLIDGHWYKESDVADMVNSGEMIAIPKSNGDTYVCFKGGF